MIKYRWLNLVILIGVLVLLLLIVGCGQNSDTNSGTGDGSEDVIDLNREPKPLVCVPGWKCSDSKTKAYQLENCSYMDAKTCPLGCANNTCNVAELCTPGWKCKGDYYRGYQTEGCDWIKKTRCDNGCVNATCSDTPIEPVEETATAEEEPAPVITYSILSMGQIATITANEAEHNLSIYNIGEEGVIIDLDGKKSAWLTDNSNYTSNGVKIIVDSVLFQNYPGGKKEISYRIG